jgi:hypothetical protein
VVGAASTPAAAAAPSGAAGRVGAACATVLECLPALVAAWLVLRIVETVHGGAAGLKTGALFGPALANDLLALLRHACLLLPVALPLALLPGRRARVLALGLVWSLLLAVHALLLQYHWTAGVPLGADLFGYSRAEIATTLGARTGIDPVLALGLVAALALLWVLLDLSGRGWWPRAGARAALLGGAVAATVSAAALVLVPGQFVPPTAGSEAGIDYLRNKTAYFVDRSASHLAGDRGQAAGGHDGHGQLPWSGKDPAYPFLHADRTPDTLGPLLANRAGTPPNLVFIIVEGLGRSFSGPGARLGSFTPFLDELGRRSLYFENFLSGQGRTFGVLSTVFGSLPFGDSGLAALGARMPRHDSLLSILKDQGYRLDYYSGSNLEFDNQGAFLRAEGVENLMSERDFAAPYRRSGYWGYADRDLVTNTLRHQAGLRAQPQSGSPQPSLSIIQTVSMHDPFEFPDKPAYLEKVGRRLAALGIAPGANPAYTAQREIFASILYTDDALRLYFEQAARLPGYENTIFVITGDHRLPELPMDTRIERYHVPLIVYSPLLKEARSIKAVSSQFDIAPSVLSLLAHNHGIRTPRDVTWLGTGLDTERTFRNLHAIPLKQTKTELSDFVSGTVYLAQDRLYALDDGMATDRALDDAALARARAQFRAFEAANRMAGNAAALAPRAAAQLAPYREEGRALAGVALASAAGQVGVSGVRLRAGSPGTVEATLHNAGSAASPSFVPLLVVSDANGLEVTEVQAAPQTLAPGASTRLTFAVALGRVPHGTYYVSVIPSHPETGRSLGIGQYHVEMQL